MYNLMKNLKNITYKLERNRVFFIISILLLLLLWIYGHVYKIESVPAGLHIDEVSMAYDAYCLATWGVDRNLIENPIYSPDVAGASSVLYLYICALLFKIFSPSTSTMLIRAPFIIFSLISLLALLYFFSSNFNYIIGTLAGLLYCVMPYFIMQSRFGLDCNLLLHLIIISTVVLSEAIKKQNNILYFISGILWGLSLYTYAIAYIVVPVILLLTLFYLIYIRKISIKNVIIFCIPFITIIIPICLFLIINYFELPQIKIFSLTITRVKNFRSNDISSGNIIKRLYYGLLYSLTYDKLNYNAIPLFYSMYFISIPLILIGLIRSFKTFFKSIKEKVFSIDCFSVFTFIASLIAIMMINEANINRINMIYFCYLCFVVNSFVFICKLNKIQLLSVPLIIIYLCNFIKFTNYYYNIMPDQNTSFVYFYNRLYDDLDTYQLDRLNSKKVFINTPYFYYLLEYRVDPHTIDIDEINSTNRINNYYFASELLSPKTAIGKFDSYVLYSSDSDYFDIYYKQDMYTEIGKTTILFSN